MFTATLIATSITALSQFALHYWRAVLAVAASQQVSASILVAAQVENGRVTGRDFEVLASLYNLTPDLHPGRGGLGFVRLYYRIVDGIGVVAGQRMPAMAAWCERELTICARYAVVQIDRRMADLCDSEETAL